MGTLTSSNVFNFGQPITQNQVSYPGQYGGGSQQSLNLSYNIPVNIGVPPQQQPYQPPQMPSFPSYPTQPPVDFSPPVSYPPVSYPPAPAPQPQPQPQPNMTNIFNILIQILNQQQAPQPQPQDDMMSFLLIILLLKDRIGGREPEPEPRPRPKPAPKPTPRPVTPPKITVDTEEGTFKKEGQKVAKMGSPIVLDLNGDGVKTSDKKLNFDIDGDGKQDELNDISNQDGVLVIDSDGDGKAGSSGKELLGDNTDLSRFGIQGKFNDGFEALNAIAVDAMRKGLINQDRFLDADELKVLEREYGLKIKNSLNGEAKSLADAGVTSMDIFQGTKQRVTNFDGQGNDTLKMDTATFTRADGSTGSYEDIFFAFK